MNYFKKISLLIVVFLTGASVLVIEIVATRILSPYYGNTIFTVSGVISTVLAALSIGYYFGGKLADKYPTEKVFYSIILISGLSVVVLGLLMSSLLPSLGYSLSIVSGPVISAIILFFMPCLLLGTLTPFAVKLQKLRFPEKGIGNITGEVFFWSTLGSIFGSLLAGFVLVPQVGISRIVSSVAIVLIVLGFLPLTKNGIIKKTIFKIIPVIVVGILLISIFSTPAMNDNIVYGHDGVYEKIIIYDGEYQDRPTRFFRQDRSRSGAMFLDSNDPTELAYEYTKYYSLYKIFSPDVKNALAIGGGAYSVPKALLAELPDATVDVVEIEPLLFDLAKKYFRVEDNPNLHNYTEDGRRFLRESDKQYDLIFGDAYYSIYSIPVHFTTQEFFTIAKEKLADGGVFIANIAGDLSRQQPSFITSEIKTFQTVFPNSYFFTIDDSPSIIFVGLNSNKTINFNDPNIINNEDPIIKSLGKNLLDLDRFEFSEYPILTDNFAPVEYLMAKVIQRAFMEQPLIDGNEMLAVVNQQLRYEPRDLNDSEQKSIQKLLIAEMTALAQETKIQTWEHLNPDEREGELVNIIGRFYPTKEKRIILATHYNSNKLVSGTGDSASGVAVLIELARILSGSSMTPNVGIDIVFFDGEEGWENLGDDYINWKPLGSTYFAEHLSDIYGQNEPLLGIVLGEVCNKDLEILKDASSIQNASVQTEAFWRVARKIDGNIFLSKVGDEIRYDHTPLNQIGIPSFLIVGSDYPSINITNDVQEKCSAKSMESVAEAVLSYIYEIE